MLLFKFWGKKFVIWLIVELFVNFKIMLGKYVQLVGEKKQKESNKYNDICFLL